MSNTYSDATGVLTFADGHAPTRMIRALFGSLGLEHPHADAGPNGAYIGSLGAEGNTSWETVAGALFDAAEEMQLVGEDEDDLPLSEVVARIATSLGVEVPTVASLDEVDFDEDADIETLFELALRLDDGHGLKAITWEGAHHSDRMLISGFGGFGFHGSRHVRVWNNSQRPLVMGEELDAAIATQDFEKAAGVIETEITRLLDSVVDDAARNDVRSALIARLGNAASIDPVRAATTPSEGQIIDFLHQRLQDSAMNLADLVEQAVRFGSMPPAAFREEMAERMGLAEGGSVAPEHLEMMTECVQIRQGEHPGWSGDPVLNADTFCRQIGSDTPEEAEALATDLEANAEAFSEALGMSPDRVRYYANRVREGIASSPVSGLDDDQASGEPEAEPPCGPAMR
jgi:hypothetical protein